MARRFYAGKLTVGLENEEVTSTDVEATPADAEGVDNLETHLLEVADSTAEGEAREQAIDEAEDTVEELEADLADAEVAQESGGLSKDAAAILQRNVANKLNRIGLAAPHAVAVESFGSASSRASSTRLAMEGIKDGIRRAWEAIIAAIKKSIQWVKDHFNKVFGSYEALVKRAKAVAQRAENTTGSIEERAFENDGLYARLMTGAKTVAVTDLTGTFKTVTETVLGKMDDFVTKAESAVEKVSALDKETMAVPADVTSLLNDSLSLLGTAAKDVSDDEKKKYVPDAEKAHYTVQAVSNLPGNKHVVVVAGAANDAAARPALFKVKLEAQLTKNADVSGKKLNTLTVDQITSVAEMIENLAGEFVQSRKKFDKIADAKAKLVKQAERVSKLEYTSEDENAAAAKTSGKEVQKTIMSINRLLGDFPAQYAAYFVTTAKSALDYCELSLRNYKKD
jgi:hypothetical protein